eukprot:GFUD01009892.1.p1 GENE.GFUD01009892.1~~GFUD01009892.1.p1  ORF type:complete len:761 (+),score=236.03 GFUD01009892.1:117-2399(+)
MTTKLCTVLPSLGCLLLPSLLLYGSTWASPLDKPPQIVKELNKQTVLKFGSFNRFVLECRGDADPAPTYQWFKNNQPLSPDSPDSQGITLMSDDDHSQLDFSSPSSHHAGYYYCEATNPLGKARSTVSHVAPTFPPLPEGSVAPVFIKAPKTELKSIGSRVELSCEAEGTPPPSISWTKNGEPLPEAGGSTLIISSLSQEDVANYACNASNIAGYQYKNVIVNILTVLARIKEGPAKQLVASKGSNVSLPCEAEGYPKPIISWTVNGTLIGDSVKYSVDTDSGQLTVKQASVEDEGEYKCRATNHGEDTAEGTLIVKSITTIIDGPKDSREEVFSSIEMKCKVVADMTIELTVTWKKNNIDLGQPGFPSDERIYQDEHHSLVLKNLTFADSGTYTCVARNSLNTDTDSGLLTVVGIKPELTIPTRPGDMLVGEDVTIPCQVALGWPAPQVTWYKDNDRVDMEKVDIDQDNTLKIRNAQKEHSGSYICRAENSEGSDSLEIDLNVRNKSVIVSGPSHLEFKQNSQVTFDCQVQVDSALLGGLQILWFKDGVNLDLIQAPEPPPVIGENRVRIAEDVSPCDSYQSEQDPRLYMLSNSSLRICSLNQSDIGEYYCQVQTNLEHSLTSQTSSVFLVTYFPWWILILTLLLILLLVLLICLTWCCKRRKVGKGYYGMDIEDGVKHNKSDIYYTTEDAESIMNEMDDTANDGQQAQEKTPIFTPRSIQHLARVDKSIGSVGSLLEDDDFMDKGFEEDGSFRERYAE